MKMNFIVTLLTLLFVGCTRPEPAPLTPQQQEIALKEISGTLDAIVQGLEKMDAEVLFQSYANSPNFILFMTDGSTVDYQSARKHHIEWFKSISSLKVTTVAKEFRIITGDVATCAWRTRFALGFKSGQEARIDFAITLLFNRTDDHWKVVYQQTAALPTGGNG
jgi:ketosteroid isomerase-like protein